MSCAEAMLRSIETACRSPLLLAGLHSRSLAVATLYDVLAVLQHGRPTVLCALADAQRIFNRAEGAFRSAGPDSSVSRSTRRCWTSGSKKLDFFLSWANELPASEYVSLHQLALLEAEHHRCAPVQSSYFYVLLGLQFRFEADHRCAQSSGPAEMTALTSDIALPASSNIGGGVV